MPWLSSRPPGASSVAQPRRVARRCCAAPTCSTMPIEAIASNGSPRELAPVHDADVDAVGERPPRRARSRASAACGSDSVMPVTWTPCSRAACSANAPQPQPTSSTRSPGWIAELACRPARASCAGPPRASSPRARRSRTSTSSTRRGRARSTRWRRRSGGGPSGGRARCCGACLRAQLGGGRPRRRGQAGGADGRGAASRALARASSGGGRQCRAARAPRRGRRPRARRSTYARPRPSWPGARSAWATACGERTWNVGRRAPLSAAASCRPTLHPERAVGERGSISRKLSPSHGAEPSHRPRRAGSQTGTRVGLHSPAPAARIHPLHSAPKGERMAVTAAPGYRSRTGRRVASSPSRTRRATGSLTGLVTVAPVPRPGRRRLAARGTGCCTGATWSCSRSSTSLTGLGVTVGFHRLLHPPQLQDAAGGARDARDPRLGRDRGPGHLLGRRPPQAPRVLRPGGRPAQPARRPRPRLARRAARPVPRARRLAVHPHPARAQDALRARPARRPDDPLRRPHFVLWALGRAGRAVRPRLADRRLAGRRADRAAVGRRCAHARGPPRDLQHQLDLPLLRPTRFDTGTSRATCAGWRRSRSARRGTTTTTPSRRRRSTACSGGSSTPRRSSSGRSSAGLAWDVVRVSPERMARKAI